jgi:hypothetical protein
MTETKRCTQCKETKTIDLFTTDKGVPRSWCKKCSSEKAKAYYRKKNPNARDMSTYELPYGKRDDPNYDRKWKIANLYNLTDDRVAEILNYQDSRCSMCLVEFDGSDFAIDHDHSCCPDASSCGKCVRGFLCLNCNTGLGKLKDDIDVLQRAIDYLSNNPFYDRRRS